MDSTDRIGVSMIAVQMESTYTVSFSSCLALLEFQFNLIQLNLTSTTKKTIDMQQCQIGITL